MTTAICIINTANTCFLAAVATSLDAFAITMGALTGTGDPRSQSVPINRAVRHPGEKSRSMTKGM